MTEAIEPPVWPNEEPSCRWLLDSFVSPRTDIWVRAVDLEAVESAPRRSEEASAALPELSTSFFVLVLALAEAAHDVLAISTTADATKRRLARGILRRIAGVFSVFVELGYLLRGSYSY